VLVIAAAVLFLVARLINAAEVSTKDVLTLADAMFVGLALPVPHAAGTGGGRATRGRRR
jgi:hypothetical protein